MITTASGLTVRDVREHALDVLELGGVDLVDDHDVGHAQVGLAGVVGELVARAERIGDGDVEIRLVEREVVVAAVPHDHVRLLLGPGEDVAVVDAGVHDHPELDGRLVLLALLGGRVGRVDVGERREALDAHRLEVAVRHRVPHERDPEPGVAEDPPDRPARLALAAARAHRGDGDHRPMRLEHRRVRSQQPEVGTGGEHRRRVVHDVGVGDVGVGEHHLVDVVVADDVGELGLRPDRDPVRVERPRQRRRVRPVVDPGDLGGRERDHPRRRVVAVDDVEVVEVTTSGSHDHDLAHRCDPPSARSAAAGAGAGDASTRSHSTRSRPLRPSARAPIARCGEVLSRCVTGDGGGSPALRSTRMGVLDGIVARALPVVPRGIVRRVSAPYIAGPSLDDATRVVAALNAAGKLATVDVLGEEIRSPDEARAIAGAYRDVLTAIRDGGLDANVSVKLTALGLDARSGALPGAAPGRRRARRRAGCVRADRHGGLELHRRDAPALSRAPCLGRRQRRHRSAGCAPPDAPRHRGSRRSPSQRRLCKGIYVESARIAYQDAETIRRSFLDCLEALLAGGSYVGVATHDERLIVESLARLDGMPASAYELQMLLGVREGRASELVAAGHRLRVYVPFGQRWYEYSLRRLQENPAMATTIAKATVGRVVGRG